MATDVSKRPWNASDWKVKVIGGIFLFLVGVVGLSGVLPLGMTESMEWLSSTALVLVGLSVMMYGFATIR